MLDNIQEPLEYDECRFTRKKQALATIPSRTYSFGKELPAADAADQNPVHVLPIVNLASSPVFSLVFVGLCATQTKYKEKIISVFAK